MPETDQLPILESNLAPREDGPVWRRDLAVLIPLVLLAAVLLPVLLLSDWSDFDWSDLDYPRRLIMSPSMLLAVAMLVALRAGAVDLSVWLVADLAGVLTAWMVLRGHPPEAALLTALAAGAVVGVVNAMLVTRLRVASPAATLAVAIVIMLVLRPAFGEGELRLPPTDGSSALLPYDATVFVAAMVYVLVLASVTVAAMARLGRRLTKPRGLFCAMCASGVIAAAGGICRLIDTSAASVATMPIGELRIPTAAVLAGGAMLAGTRRGTMSLLCLLPAMLVTTVWLLETPPWWVRGYYLHVAGLIVLAVGVQVLLKRAFETPGVILRVSAFTAVAGMTLIAVSGRTNSHPMETALAIAGWALFIQAVIIAIIKRIKRPARRTATTLQRPAGR